MGWLETRTIKQAFAVLGALLALILSFYGIVSLIDERIDQKIKDEEFVNKVSEKIRRPFVIFEAYDKGVGYPYDSGGLKYIEKIKLDLKKAEHRKIIVTTSEWLPLPPLIECLEEKIVFDVSRGKGQTWVYTEAEWRQGGMFVDTAGPSIRHLFRLEIIK